MIDYPKAVLARNRKLVRCDIFGTLGEACGYRLGRIVFDQAAEAAYFRLLEKPTFDAFDDHEALEDAQVHARIELANGAYFAPRARSIDGPRGRITDAENAWLVESDEEGEYIRLGDWAFEFSERFREEPRSRRSLAEADYDVLSGAKPYTGASTRYTEPVRVLCPWCDKYSIVDPEPLIEESIQRREMRSIILE